MASTTVIGDSWLVTVTAVARCAISPRPGRQIGLAHLVEGDAGTVAAPKLALDAIAEFFRGALGQLRDLAEHTGQVADGRPVDGRVAVLRHRDRLLGHALGKGLAVQVDLVGRALERNVEVVRVLYSQLDLILLFEDGHLARDDLRQRHLRRLQHGVVAHPITNIDDSSNPNPLMGPSLSSVRR